MAGLTKSVLLVDYGSLQRSVTALGGKAASAFAAHVREWVAALESGSLIEPAGKVRTLMVRRCYADPGAIGPKSAGFEAAGFEMVDLGGDDGEGSADLAIAVDAIEAVSHGDATEVILLSASPGLAHLIKRIKARGRSVVAYAEESMADSYGAAADGIVNAADFADVLNMAAAPQDRPKGLTADRGRIETFAREVNAATGIPMFSPKTFTELFRLLCEEIATNGYHFQSTAKNVAERLGGSGRSVTSRQVVFVVKGLALKGHVFSTTDTPERLAEVFLEQARYLIAGAGITLDAEREKLLSAWIAAAPGVRAAQQPKKELPRPAPPPPVVPAKPAPVAAARPAPIPVKPVPVPPKPAPVARPAPPSTAEAPKPVRKPAPERRPEPASEPPPVATAKPQPPRMPERPKSAALPPKPAPPPPEPAKPTPADVRAQIAARIAASARIKPSGLPVAAAPKPQPKAAEMAPPHKPDAIESSILAAIAQAVDVLVEDSGGKPATSSEPPARKQSAEPPRQQAPAEKPPAPPPDPLPEPEEGSDDIGDEIQRIVATYNRNRTEGERGK
ncbi:hypothetical protein BH10PSE9_BH10PSE9_20530 [soil metagenome]